MEQYTLKLTSGTSYRLYQGSTLVTDSDLTALFSTAGSAYFNFDFNGGTPSATNTAVIVDSNGVTIVTITATILDSANYKGVWGDSATTFTSFDSLSGKSLDESQLSFLMGEIKESPVVGTDISTVIDTAFVSTANIQSDAVTTPKIADYNVTAEKLASESVTTAKIEDGAVTPDKASFTTYSTTEQRIGTWKDGKPLYRRVVEITSPSTAGSGESVVNYSSWDVSELINVYGRIKSTNNTAFSSGNQFYIWDRTTTKYIAVQVENSTYTNYPMDVIVEYTKTTE